MVVQCTPAVVYETGKENRSGQAPSRDDLS